MRRQHKHRQRHRRVKLIAAKEVRQTIIARMTGSAKSWLPRSLASTRTLTCPNHIRSRPDVSMWLSKPLLALKQKKKGVPILRQPGICTCPLAASAPTLAAPLASPRQANANDKKRQWAQEQEPLEDSTQVHRRKRLKSTDLPRLVASRFVDSQPDAPSGPEALKRLLDAIYQLDGGASFLTDLRHLDEHPPTDPRLAAYEEKLIASTLEQVKRASGSIPEARGIFWSRARCAEEPQGGVHASS